MFSAFKNEKTASGLNKAGWMAAWRAFENTPLTNSDGKEIPTTEALKNAIHAYLEEAGCQMEQT